VATPPNSSGHSRNLLARQDLSFGHIIGERQAIDAWTSAASLTEGQVFRPVNRGDRLSGDSLSEKVVWQLIRPYAEAAGVPGIAPHDCRPCAKLCRAAGGKLEQIQLLLGHASVQTTERYLGTKQDLVNAPNDGIKLRVPA
jgi:integrase